MRATVVVDDRLQSCESGLGTARGVLLFERSGARLGFQTIHPGPAMVVRGAQGGLGLGYFTILTRLAEHSPKAVNQCLGEGIQYDGAMDLTFRTVTRLIG